MAKITWVKISHSRKYGGGSYANKVIDVIKNHFDFEAREIAYRPDMLRYLKPVRWFFQISKIRGFSDIWVMDSFIVVAFANFKNMQGKKVIVLHHIDHTVFSVFIRPIAYFLEKVFHAKAKKADMVVVVSGYWKDYLATRGYKNIKIIHNSFDVNSFNITGEEVDQFKKTYGFDSRPIIYLGNSLKAKGVVESYEALKNFNVNLVSSGERAVNIPAKNLNLDYRNYLRLLKASFIVVTMSKFKEGWCTTAHEAMLCGTPVIGSGLGGMKELLAGGGQMVCPDFKDLAQKVAHLLSNHNLREKMGQDGHYYAAGFTMEKFNKEWLGLIEAML